MSSRDLEAVLEFTSVQNGMQESTSLTHDHEYLHWTLAVRFVMYSNACLLLFRFSVEI